MKLNNFSFIEFHVSRKARENYQFDQSLFSFNGNVIFANFHAARRFAQKINNRRDLINYPETAVSAGQINALGLIDEILHLVVDEYRKQRNPNVLAEALIWLEEKVGRDEIDQLLRQFTDEFPPIAVYLRQMSIDEYLKGTSQNARGESVPNRQIVLEEVLMLWITNVNPATSPYRELFDDQHLERETSYLAGMDSLYSFFETQPPFGPDYQNLIDMLRAPALAEPHSLTAQLEFIRSRWGNLIGNILYRLLSSLDLIKEEEKAIFGVGGGGPSYVYEFLGLDSEPERFSQDSDWMPNLVLIAKNSYVWLDQLSKKYEQDIYRLDQIPDKELENLAGWGFSGLWLIGLWERSAASRTIKQMRGNPEAEASAYSLFSYDIAGDLGGEESYRNLRERAWQYGIRLSSDMVPNHMGIDSRWVIEHPDWFISLNHSPFPSYSFNGPNLSWDEQVGIYIDDHYFDNSDAAVVFRRVDFWSGEEKYIYHGNDGTSMPWNDTAQLNYLIPEVREAVIQTILHVARKFPIIRFDAAMTLAKKHYQRLWYPEPGSGGDIPSRADYGITKAQFDAVFPKEFWREVVDRVAAEVPDTLLLAEAFWLMEGYFVRTLGMHRVYNSAFMNMLRDEKNQEYRLVIKNTLEFDPEILKRYVNFMNNPDERTAVDQFGKGDKYIGVCTLMATLPGLPMFGHGQIEGFTEKYGMEYRKAYWEETVDGYLVERHEREIFPLLHKRWLFSEVTNFLLYDFNTTNGAVNEDVFAYSNKAGQENSLVIYHNKYSETAGWIKTSSAYLDKSRDERKLVQKSLAQGLELDPERGTFVIFRDHIDQLEYIRRTDEIHERGMFIELRAYQSRVLLDFRQVKENEWGHYGQLSDYLAGRGVPSIEDALKELYLQPVHHTFRQLVNPGMFRWLINNRQTSEIEPDTLTEALNEYRKKAQAILISTQIFSDGDGTNTAIPIEQIASDMMIEMESALRLPAFYLETISSESDTLTRATDYLEAGLIIADNENETAQSFETDAVRADNNLISDNNDQIDSQFSPLADGDQLTWGTLFGYLAVKHLGRVITSTNPEDVSRAWMDEWLLGRIISSTLIEMGCEPEDTMQQIQLIKLLITHPDWCEIEKDKSPKTSTVLKDWLADPELASYLGVNRYQDTLWYRRESYKTWLWWAYTASVIQIAVKISDPEETQDILTNCFKIIESLVKAGSNCGCQVEKLIELVDEA